jgi:lipid II:glycine glycyltransferase (peptidoglycan interpeptide bridge formation enzyme)
MYLVNTSASEAALRASLSQSWRQKLKRAEKTDISVRVCNPRQKLEQFLRLHDEMLQRKQFDDRNPRTVLPLLLEHLPGDRMQMFIAQRGSELVAAAVVFTGGDLAFYLYGASSSSALPLNGGRTALFR